MTKAIITIVRVAIGWHFLYEGIIKLFTASWSAANYLDYSTGFLAGFYKWLAISPARLAVIDFLNIWGLISIGLLLFVGLYVRFAAVFGAILLVLYYMAYPSFGIVNHALIEALVLVFFVCYKETGYGIGNAYKLFRKEKAAHSTELETNTEPNQRRQILKELITLPVLGLFGWNASRTGKMYGYDTLSGATIQINHLTISDLKGELPKGKIGNQELSRLVMGGNLIGGWSHARDLIYTDKLFRAYNHERKIFETLTLCEQAGINCINIGYPTMQTMVKYRKVTGSKMKVIVQIPPDYTDGNVYKNVYEAIDNGMDIMQVHGYWCDRFVRDNQLDMIEGFVRKIKENGYVCGIGAHDIHSLMECENNKIIPDYYMVTMHHDNYWSAHPRENRKKFEVINGNNSDHNMYHDNCFCTFPDETIEFVNSLKVPVMGFKILAAGAIQPKDGFNWAFENGADFICVGMFDFQVVDDVNICIDTLNNMQNRQRKWYS